VGLIGDSIRGRRMKDPVEGTAQVVGSTQPPDSATSSNVNLNLVVQAEGIPATSVEHSCMAPTKKWPWPGATLPVTIDRADPSRLRVRWDDVPDANEVAKQRTEALAAQMNAGGAGQAGLGGTDVSELIDSIRQAIPGAQISAQGMPGLQGTTAGGEEDKVGQLERLAKLHESGALTDKEFEREKARILGSG
jgi:hypothetical protein